LVNLQTKLQKVHDELGESWGVNR